MKRLFLFLTSLLVTIVAMADGIDRNTALQKAQKFMPGKVFVEGKTMASARANAPQEPDAFYVFNAKDGDGFVIVAGDDRAPEILGYSKHGTLDTDNLPANLKWWLDNYARQIKALGTSLVPVQRSAGLQSSGAIAPLIQSAWNQGAPYNYMCPDGNYVDYDEPGYDPGNRCVTGCVATAMAQVMYYWKWPESCPALPSYQIDENHTIKALPATTFEWDKMKNTYDWEETGPAADAVAKLMRYCGQSVQMYYTPDESGANVSPQVMASVFQYSPNCHTIQRDGYSANRWESIIYDELAAQRPVLYCGFTAHTGHQFIVDGADGNGLFHINWGWGGYPDSYYVLAIGDHEQGIDYPLGQRAIVGLKPAEQGEVMLPSLTSNINRLTPTVTYNRTSTSTDFENVSMSSYYNASYALEPTTPLDVEIGWGLVQGDELLQVLDSKTVTISPSTWWYDYYSASSSFGAGLADGEYQLSNIYRFAGDTEWKFFDLGASGTFLAEVNGKSMTVRVPTPEIMKIKVNSITITDEPAKNGTVGVKANITNIGEGSDLYVGLWIQKDNSPWKNTMIESITLPFDQSADIYLTFVPDEAGTYQIKLTLGGTDEALTTATVKVADSETMVIDGVTYLCIPEYGHAKVIRPQDGNVYQSNVTIQPTVTCNGVDCKTIAIDDYAFNYFYNVTSLTIPEGVETIGNYAFTSMYSLTKLDLPSSLKAIGEYVIDYDNNLTTVASHITEPFAISDLTFGYQSWNSTTQQYEFLPCSATLFVPEGTKAKYEALSGWTWFAAIEEGEIKEALVDGLKYSYMSNGTTATVIRDASYEELTEVTVPATVTLDGKTYRVTAIGKNAFNSCWNLRTVTLSEGLESLDDYAFASTPITEITLPSTLKTIGNHAFDYSRQIKKLVIPEGVETIGNNAFAYMSSLTTLDLPNSLKTIGNNVIYRNEALIAVTSRIMEPFAISNKTFGSEIWNGETQQYDFVPSSATLYVPIGTKAKYEALSGWTWFAAIEEGELKEAVADGLKYLYATGGTTATVIKDDSYQELTEVTIPATVSFDGKTYQVTAIGKNAFDYCWILQSVTLPEGLEIIDDYAFRSTGLQEISLPGTLKKIGNSAFRNTTSLQTLIIPEGVETIGGGAFCYMYKLRKLELPASLKEIGENLIQDDGALSAVVSRITEPFAISDNTFGSQQWNGETQQYDIYPSSATLYIPIGTKAQYEALSGWTWFAAIEEGEQKETVVDGLKYAYGTGGTTATVIPDESYKEMTEVTIPATVVIDGKTYQVTAVGDNAFYNCLKLTSLTLSEGLESIGNNAFNNTRFSEVTLPSTLKTIGNNAFEDCFYIKTLVIPEGVETIGHYAFSYMYNLKKLELPNSLRALGERLTWYSTDLEAVVSHITEPFAINDNTFAYNGPWNEETWEYELVPSSATLYVPIGTKEKYEALSGWTWFAAIEEGEMKETVFDGLKYAYTTGGTTATVIQDGSYQEMTEVTIPAAVVIDGKTYQVTAIGDYAFLNCWNLRSVTLSEGLENIGYEAFCSTSLTEITLPNTLRTIGGSAFYYCYNIKNLIIPEGVESIGSYAFASMYGLLNLELPSSLKEIGEQVIRSDSYLTSVVSHFTEPFNVSDNTFASEVWNGETQQYDLVPSSATLYVPEGTKERYEALSGWKWFAGIEEGEIKEVMVDKLKYAYNTIGTTATVIQDDSYRDFTEVTIPATVVINGDVYQVTGIGNSAFNSCWNLTSLTLSEGLETIGSSAFSYASFSELTLPSTLKKIGNSAFYYCYNVTKLIIPEGVESIGNSAFATMYRMTYLELPSTLKEIGESVIQGTEGLTAVVSHITEPFAVSDYTFADRNWNNETQQYDVIPSRATLYVPIGTKDKYEALSGWTWFAAIEEGELKETFIDGLKYAYSTGGTIATVVQDDSYKEFTEVTIPATVVIDGRTYQVLGIGDNAFYYCKNLQTVTLSEGLESIGTSAFNNTTFSEITLPTTLKTINAYAFYYSYNVGTLVIPEGVETIGSYAFAYMYGLKKLELPSSLKSIGEHVINKADELTEVICHITAPYNVSDYTFATEQYNYDTQEWEILPSPATLYVPMGTKELYEALSGWKWFAGIEENPNDNGIAHIRYQSDSDAWYTLQGVRVNNPQKGVFIRNGKKVVVK